MNHRKQVCSSQNKCPEKQSEGFQSRFQRDHPNVQRKSSCWHHIPNKQAIPPVQRPAENPSNTNGRGFRDVL